MNQIDLHQEPSLRSQQASIPVPTAWANYFFDVILRNPVNLGKRVSTVVMLNDSGWILMDSVGMPVWGVA
jgi:hypothetical protein